MICWGCWHEVPVAPHPRMPQIYLYRDPVDFRKSFRGLAAIVEQLTLDLQEA